MIKSFFNNTMHVIITALSVVLIMFVVLFSNKTGQIDLKVGDVSTEDIYAPRAIVDSTTTNATREAARKGVENVYIANDNKRLSAVDSISDFFAIATTLRGDEGKSIAAASAQLQAQAKLDISASTALTVMNASKAEFSEIRKVSDIYLSKFRGWFSFNMIDFTPAIGLIIYDVALFLAVVYRHIRNSICCEKDYQ